jgi:hypothetical protein
MRSGDIERYAQLADVSATGARIVTAAPPQAGSLVRLRFDSAAARSGVDSLARVVWATAGYRGRGGMIGVEFLVGASLAARNED